MAKGRSGANRGWRSKMEKALAENPELQAKVNSLTLTRLERRKETLQETSSAISGELERLQAEIDKIGSPETVD